MSNPNAIYLFERFTERKTSEAEQSVKNQRGSPEKPTGPDYFNYLNEDCLSKIFKYLSIKQRLDVVTVCKRWRDASQFAWDDIKTLNFKNPSLPWQGESKELPPAYRTKNCTAKILQNCGSSLRELELGTHVNPDILGVIAQHCCNLTKLEVDVSEYEACVSPDFIRQMKNLSFLKMKGRESNFSKAVFEALPTETLTELHFSYNVSRSLVGRVYLSRRASEIIEKLPNLTALTLEKFALQTNTLRSIGGKNQLTYLSLAHCTLRSNDVGVSSLALLTNLEHLNLSFSKLVNNDLIKEISRNLTNLKYLNLQHSKELQNNGVESLANLPQLEELDLSSNGNITDHAVRNLRHLKKLTIGNCNKVKNAGIIELLQRAPNLEYLDLVNTDVTMIILGEAGTVTTNRAHNVPLKVRVGKLLQRFFQPHALLCPLLIIDGPDENIHYGPIYEDESDESEIGHYESSSDSS